MSAFLDLGATCDVVLTLAMSGGTVSESSEHTFMFLCAGLNTYLLIWCSGFGGFFFSFFFFFFFFLTCGGGYHISCFTRYILSSTRKVNFISNWSFIGCFEDLYTVDFLSKQIFQWLFRVKRGSYFSLSESEVAQSCPTLCNLVDCSPPGFSIYGVLQARTLEWVAISFSRAFSQPRDRTPHLLHCRQML